VPSAWELLRGEMVRRVAEPLSALQAVRSAVERPRQALATWRDSLAGLGEVIATALVPASPTPLNTDLGSHRRFDWLAMDLTAVQEVKRRLGGTVNDVVLAVVSGALGRFLHRRGLAVEALDFRAMIPVNVRSEAERGQLGNRVSFMVVRLPLAERDPCRRLERVRELVGECKRSRQALGLRVLEEVGDRTFASLFIGLTRMAAVTRPYNIVVTNVPGPQATLYLLGAPMRAIFPLVPLFGDQALGIALFSYDGTLHWGFNADWDALPDLHDIVDAVRIEFAALAAAAERRPAPEATPARGVARARRRGSRRVVG
jgi:WS/DGAT/MGAT family acyltransferase